MKVTIKEPCLEDWDKMKIGIESRHCDLCSKNVIDFTQKNRAEIITYLLDRSNERVCGRMKGNEFEMKEADIPVLMEILRAPRFRSNAFMILAIVCSSVFSSCEILSDEDAVKKNAKVGVEKFDNMENSHTTLGMMSPYDSTVVDENSNSFVSDETSEKGKDRKIRFVPPPPPIPEPDRHIIEWDENSNLMLGEPIIEPIHPEQKDKEEILTFAEVMPEFPGGMEKLLIYLKNNIIYPTAYLEQGIEGKVYVQFVVTAEGMIESPVVLKGVANAELFSKEALRVVKSMPKWTPGKNDGKNVNVKTTIPVAFKLN